MTDFPVPPGHVPAYSSRRFATTEGPAPVLCPECFVPNGGHKMDCSRRRGQVDTAAEPGLTVTERAVDVVKNVLVIVTCLAILYALYQASVAIDAMSDGLAELSRTFGQ